MEELKVGDFVTIKPFDWYDKNKDAAGNIYKECYHSFTPGMSKYCGEVAMITHVIWGYYHINLDSSYYNWELYMFNLPEEINNKNNNMELKHKIGDVIQIKSRVWYNINKNEYGDVISSEGDAYFTSSLAKYCGHQAQIISIEKLGDKSYYKLDIDKPLWNWEDWMFEDSDEGPTTENWFITREELIEKLKGSKTYFETAEKAEKLHDLLEDLFDWHLDIYSYVNYSHISVDEDGNWSLFDSIREFEDCDEDFLPIDEILKYEIREEENSPITSFKPFDKVLVRDDDTDWIPAFYKCYEKGEAYPHNTMEGDSFSQCIPYEGNEDKVAYLYEG